jgi:predicted ATPase
MKNWYVITGGPSSGITCTADYLATLGYYTIPEAARVLIDNEISRGKSLEEIRGNELAFQQAVLRLKQETESRTPRDRTAFFQRGIPDTLAYYRYIGADTSGIESPCRRARYRRVFILEPIPYRQDHARTEGEEGARRLFELIKETYEKLGFDVRIIPRATIEERAAMIIKHVEKVQT